MDQLLLRYTEYGVPFESRNNEDVNFLSLHFFSWDLSFSTLKIDVKVSEVKEPYLRLWTHGSRQKNQRQSRYPKSRRPAAQFLQQDPRKRYLLANNEILMVFRVKGKRLVQPRRHLKVLKQPNHSAFYSFLNLHFQQLQIMQLLRMLKETLQILFQWWFQWPWTRWVLFPCLLWTRTLQQPATLTTWFL